jgi:hypothetical protein
VASGPPVTAALAVTAVPAVTPAPAVTAALAVTPALAVTATLAVTAALAAPLSMYRWAAKKKPFGTSIARFRACSPVRLASPRQARLSRTQNLFKYYS